MSVKRLTQRAVNRYGETERKLSLQDKLTVNVEKRDGRERRFWEVKVTETNRERQRLTTGQREG